MNNFRVSTYAPRHAIACIVAIVVLAASASGQHYNRTDLTQNAPGVSMSAAHTDPNLVNSWGLARSSTSFWWVSDNGTGLATLYDGTGAPQMLKVNIPLPNGQTGTSAPTGAAFNDTKSFLVGPSAPAIFLFVTEDGTISGWNPGIKPTDAVLVVDRSNKAIYKGCALAQTFFGPRLYATNFQTGRIEVFDGNFKLLKRDDHAFRDPFLPRNFVPFNIQNVGGNLVVTFARRSPGSKDEDHGAGLGFVDVFSTSGRLLLRLQHGPWFNAPWGVTAAPSDFGAFSHRLLIGNFGDGTIHAFNVVTGRFEGALLDGKNSPLTIDGLWALSFGGNNSHSGFNTELFFTSGPNDESNGIFGKVIPVATEQRGNTE